MKMSWLFLQALGLAVLACKMPALPYNFSSLTPSFDKTQEAEIAASFLAPSDDINWTLVITKDSMLRIACEPEGLAVEVELTDNVTTIRSVVVASEDSKLLTSALPPGKYSVNFRFDPSLETEDDDDEEEAESDDCDEPYFRLHLYLKPKSNVVQMTSDELLRSTEGFPDLTPLQDQLDAFNVAMLSDFNYHIKLSSLQEAQLQVLQSWPIHIPKPSEMDRSVGLTGLYKLTVTLRKH